MNQSLTLIDRPEYKTLDKQLTALAPQFEQVLARSGVPAERIIRTVMISIQKTPKLLECDRQTILNSAMSAAVLGLEVDGVTGQGYLIPFGKTAQLIIGYKGFNTLAARSGYTVNSGIVRKGDKFDYSEGTDGFVHHKAKLDNTGQITAAWATAEAKERPPIIKVMGIADIMEVKAKAPGGRKPDSPWNDPKVGFPAMCAKTVMRRLARSMPLNVMQYAAAMDEAFEERGLKSRVDPDLGTIIEGESSTVDDGQPAAKNLTDGQLIYKVPNKGRVTVKTISEWLANIRRRLTQITTVKEAEEFYAMNKEIFEGMADQYPDQVQDVTATINVIIRTLMEKGDE
jgi:recombination protein RecT